VDGAETIAEFGSGEFGIQLNHFDCESKFIDYSLSGSVATRKQLEVFDSVVTSNSVDVMNGFFGKQVSFEVLRHDVAVFRHFRFLASGTDQRGEREKNVSVTFDVPSDVAAVKSVSRFNFLRCGFAFLAAVFLIAVDAKRGRVPVSNFYFATMRTGKFVALVGCFAAALIRALQGTVFWVSAVLFSIRRQVRLHHREFIAAVLAIEFNRRSTVGAQVFLVQMCATTRNAAVFSAFLSFRWVAVEKLITIHAVQLKRHFANSFAWQRRNFANASLSCQVV
jgi:hypothetical protein